MNQFAEKTLDFVDRHKTVFFLLLLLLLLNTWLRGYVAARALEYQAMEKSYKKLVKSYQRGGMEKLKEELKESRRKAKTLAEYKFLDNANLRLWMADEPKEYLTGLLAERGRVVERLKAMLFTLNIITLSLLTGKLVANFIGGLRRKQ